MLKVLLIIACGLVFAGLVREIWQIITGRDLSFGVLFEGGLWAPVNALAVVISSPVLLIEAGLFARDGYNTLGIELLSLAGAGALAFVHGVVLLVSLNVAG